MLLVLILLVSVPNLPTAFAGEPASMDVYEYCERFAREYSLEQGLDYQAGSAQTQVHHSLLGKISNLFQPHHSRFVAGYDCTFQTGAGTYQVHIYLTNTWTFAKHTQWESLQVIPIAHIIDTPRDLSGYGIFKYLEKP